MPLSYQNRYQQVFYFKKVSTNRGRFRYYTTREIHPDCIEKLPQGYEIYEHPEYGHVYLRKIIVPQLFPQEIETIRQAVATLAKVKDYILDVREHYVTVFTTDVDLAFIQTNFPDMVANAGNKPMDLLRKAQRFDAQFNFILEHKILRAFTIQRKSWVGFSESWIDLEKSQDLEYLAQKYCPYLGLDAYYDLKPIPS